MGWDGMGWGWDGMGWDGMGWMHRPVPHSPRHCASTRSHSTQFTEFLSLELALLLHNEMTPARFIENFVQMEDALSWTRRKHVEEVSHPNPPQPILTHPNPPQPILTHPNTLTTRYRRYLTALSMTQWASSLPCPPPYCWLLQARLGPAPWISASAPHQSSTPIRIGRGAAPCGAVPHYSNGPQRRRTSSEELPPPLPLFGVAGLLEV